MSTSCDTGNWSSSDGMSIMVFLLLGAGFAAMFADISNFYYIWIFGFGVLVPIVATLSSVDGDSDDDEWTVEDTTPGAERDSTTTDSQSSGSTQDALATLRERYANGDLTDEQFERKLDRLLKTETPENAAEWRERATRTVETGDIR